MKRKTALVFWPIVAMAAIFGLGFVAALAMATRPQVVVVEAAPKGGPSAATTIITFLGLVILGLILAAAGAVLLATWGKHRQRRARLEEAVYQAQAYALLNGAKPPSPRSGGASPLPQAGGPVIVMGGAGQQYPQRQITLDDLAQAVQATQGRPAPFGGYLPPDGGG